MNHTLDDWLDYIDLNRPKEDEFGLNRLRPITDIIFQSTIAEKIVVIGGTNGKGTTAEVLNSLLLESNFKIGLYTSPHLFKFNERIRVNGVPASDSEIIDAFEEVENLKNNTRLTYFDYATLAAFIIFTKNNLDVAILEIGLGGRYDPVNLVEPDISILTNVELDHQKWLGNTREQIGEEKSAIFRDGKIIIMGSNNMPSSVMKKVEDLDAKTLQLEEDFFIDELTTNNLNKESVACSIAAYKEITNCEIDFNSVLKNTSLLGRCDVNNKFILDVSHNLASVKNLVTFLNTEFKDKSIKAVVGLMKDKDIHDIIREVKGIVSEWYACSPNMERAISANDLKELIFAETKNKVEAFETVDLAVK